MKLVQLVQKIGAPKQNIVFIRKSIGLHQYWCKCILHQKKVNKNRQLKNWCMVQNLYKEYIFAPITLVQNIYIHFFMGRLLQ